MKKITYCRIFGVLLAVILFTGSSSPALAASSVQAAEQFNSDMFTEEELDYIAKSGVITVATPADCPFLSGFDPNTEQGSGLAIDILKLIEAKSGLQFQYKQIPADVSYQAYFNEQEAQLLFPMIKSDAIPIEDGLNLLDSGLSSFFVLIGRPGEDFSPESSFVFALSDGFANAEDYLHSQYPNASFVYYETEELCMHALKNGVADITMDSLYAAYSNFRKPEFGGLIVFPSYSIAMDLLFALPESADPILSDILEKTIRSLSNEEVSQIIISNTMADSFQMTAADLIRWGGEPLAGIIALIIIVVFFLIVIIFQRQHNIVRLQNANEQLQNAIEQKNASDEANLRLQAQRRADEIDRKELRYLAEYDELTGVYNKRAFAIYTRKMLDENPDVKFAIVRGDVDRFKVYNDLFGTQAGDELLIQVAALLKSYVHGKLTTYCRLEADHFAMCCRADQLDMEQLVSFTEEWRRANITHFELRFCFGVYFIENPAVEIELMCDRALMALRNVKGNYHHRYAFYDETLREQLMLEQELIGELSGALQSDQFEVFFQPQYNYVTGEMIGAEALARWNHPARGLISPSVFIPILEKNGLISVLDDYIWNRTCEYIRKWLDLNLTPVPVSVNISRLDLFHPNLCERIRELVEQYQIPYSLLNLEITESTYVEDPVTLIEVVRQLQKTGFTVEMDDFGSGYSSLNTLKDVSVDVLKLDMKFLFGDHNDRGGSILSSVVRMARLLDLSIIAEGVETRYQADYLLSIGCKYMQGYYFSRPIQAVEFEALLQNRKAGILDDHLDHVRLIDFNELWNPQSQFAHFFNYYLGAAGIFEYSGNQLEALRLNQDFYQLLGITHEDYEPFHKNIFARFYEADRQKYRNMLDEAISTGQEVSCQLRSVPFSEGGPVLWTRTRVRLISRNGDRYLFFVRVENMAEQKHLELSLND